MFLIYSICFDGKMRQIFHIITEKTSLLDKFSQVKITQITTISGVVFFFLADILCL